MQSPTFIPKKSFSHPLVLILRGDLKQRFFVLAHELVHINLLADRDKLVAKKSKDRKIDLPDIEAVCWLVAKLALRKTIKNWPKYEAAWAQILKWDKSGKTKVDIEKLERNWNFNRTSLKEFLKIDNM